jgi:hypothetical protein
MPASAQESASSKRVDGLAVYLGVLPAELITGHPGGHAESTMHGGLPSGRHVHHVMVAVFDEATGARITDAVVKARVSGLGLAGSERALEPMRIDDTLTYGEFFDFPGSDLYRIAVAIRRPGETRPVAVEFLYDHREP